METKRTRRLGSIVAAILVAAIVIGASVIASSSVGRTSTVVSTSVFTTTVQSTSTVTFTVHDHGLELQVSDNATTLSAGQSLNVNVSIFNSFPSANSVPVSTDWAFKGVPVALWSACYMEPAAYAVVLMGNYTIQSLPSVANVDYGIGCQEAVTVDHVVFQPSSDVANVTGLYSVGGNQTIGPFHLTVDFITRGYWNLVADAHQGNTPLLSNPEFPQQQPNATPFVPGVYTLAVADEWGQLVVLHFVTEDG